MSEGRRISEDNVILSRTSSDCMVCCLAMVLGWTYEQASRYFPPVSMEGIGYYWRPVLELLEAQGLNIEDVYLPKEEVNKEEFTPPVIIDVPSLVAPDKGEHSIVWDGHRLIDPNNEEPKYHSFSDIASERVWVYEPQFRTPVELK